MTVEALKEYERERLALAETRATNFEILGEGRYRLAAPGIGTLEVDYLRREHSQLKGELLVRCVLPGAKTYSGVLSVGDLNLSSSRARASQAGYFKERSGAAEVDWIGLVEELAQRVLAAERQGEPATLLHTLPKPIADEAMIVDGFPLLERHPLVLFGDGGTAKSYLALYFAGKLSLRGLNVLYADWELAGGDHRERLERLFGRGMPAIHYVRCSRPLVYEAERLRRIVRDKEIAFAVFDSVAFACEGAPELAEAAQRYFQALRQFGPLGSLHVAHVAKALEGADKKPFGSVFWHNGARATWHVRPAETTPGDDALTVALTNRKANTAGLRPSIGFELRFSAESTTIERVNLADVPDLAASLSLGERIRHALKAGALSRGQLREKLGDGVNDSSFRGALSRAEKAGKVIRLENVGTGAGERYALRKRGHE